MSDDELREDEEKEFDPADLKKDPLLDPESEEEVVEPVEDFEEPEETDEEDNAFGFYEDDNETSEYSY